MVLPRGADCGDELVGSGTIDTAVMPAHVLERVRRQNAFVDQAHGAAHVIDQMAALWHCRNATVLRRNFVVVPLLMAKPSLVGNPSAAAASEIAIEERLIA
jgi:hypothetical protein